LEELHPSNFDKRLSKLSKFLPPLCTFQVTVSYLDKWREEMARTLRSSGLNLSKNLTRGSVD
jgi:hypothetical protein